MQASYTRIYDGDDGETHFEDLSVTLEPQNFAPPAAPLNIAPFLGATDTLWVGADPSWGGDEPHPAPQRQIFCSLRGTYEVTASDGAARRFGPGSVLMLEDTSGKGHATSIIGDEDALIFAVSLD